VRAARLACVVLLAMVLGACASSTAQRDNSGRTGLDRVSPMRAADVNTRLGVGYFERGDMKLALEKLRHAVEIDPEHVPAYVTLGMVHERLGQETSARENYRKAARLAPDDGATLNSYAAFLCRQGEYDEADGLFQRAANDPFYRTPEVAYTNAGACAIRNDRLEAAERYLRTALDIDDQYAEALYQLARLYLLRDDAFRARAFLQRYEAEVQAGAAALALGHRIESRLGNDEEAARYFRRLESDFPESAEARDIRRQNSRDD